MRLRAQRTCGGFVYVGMVAGFRGSALIAGIAGSLGLLSSGGCFGESFMEGPADGGAESSDTGMSSDSGQQLVEDSGSEGDDTTGDAEAGTTAALDDDAGESSTGAADESTDDDAGTDESTDDDAGTDDSSTGTSVLGMGDLEPGDLVITEVMWNPGCLGDNCEWFEVYNATANPVNLLDLHVQDSDLDPTDEGRITKDIIVESGGYAVLTRDADSWNYEQLPSGEYGPNPGLNNSEPDFVAILDDGGTILDETPTFPDGDQGVSWTLWIEAPDAEANDDPSNWCFSATQMPLADGDSFEYGSPLLPGSDCM